MRACASGRQRSQRFACHSIVRKLVAGILVALAATSFAQTRRTRSEVPIDGVVAVVDDSVILRSELEARVSGASGSIHTIADPGERQRRMDQLVASTLEAMVDEELILRAAIAAKLEVSDADLDVAIEEIKRENAIDDETFGAALEAQGYSVASYRAELRRNLMRQRAIDQFVAPRVHVSDQEVHAYYGRLKTSSPKASFEHMKRDLAAELQRRGLEEQTQLWLVELRRRTYVSIED